MSEPTQLVLAVLRGEVSEEEACRERDISSATYRDWESEVVASRHSDHDATLTSAMLRGTASIVRDAWGVPHCRAANVADLCFAAGVAQAQDRLWQLDYRRRLVGGRLAAILGGEWVRSDREMRTLGFYRIVEAEVPHLADESAEALESFGAGVNAWIDHVADVLPIEFDVLGYEPEAWTPTDSLAVMRYFWWTLTGRLSQLVAAERLQRRAPQQVVDWLQTPETISYIAPEWPGSGGGRDRLPGGAAEADSPADTPGSNNWVAARDRLGVGGPVLAADPHWPVAFPDMWYEQHLCGGGMDVIGPAYPGVPPVVFGRTPGLAWGRTNNVTSTRDLYHEQVNPEDPTRFRTSSLWARFEEWEERIDVRDGDAVTLTVRTAQGRPVVNEFIPSVEPEGDGPITLRWVGQETIGDVQALLDLGRARSVAEGRAIFAGWRMSVWNAVLADSEGHYAYEMCGSVPVRAVSTRGTRPAADTQHEWNGYRDTPSLPGVGDPERGWVASANNPPAAPRRMDGLYGTYADGYRHDRIGRFLGGRRDLTAAEVIGLQDDNLSLRAEELAGGVADLLAEGEPRQAEAARLLRAWNHRFDPDQAGAAVWTALWPRLVHRVGETVLDSFTAQLGAGNAGRLTRHLVLGGEAPSFFAADLAQLTGEAAETAMVYLSQALGADSATWSWERAQRLALCHPLSRCDAARRVFDPPVVRCAGGTGVVNNRSSRETPTGFEVSGGPSYRFGADLSESGGHGALLAGQSAQPGHRHYHDQLELWTQGRLHELPMLAEEIDSRRQSTTRLEPGPKDGRAD